MMTRQQLDVANAIDFFFSKRKIEERQYFAIELLKLMSKQKFK